jgi:tRNA uridine 5-carboxymethylaminomethyl modification enzyme
MQVPAAGPALGDPIAAEQVEIQIKYQGYISRQQEEIERQIANEHLKLPKGLDYSQVRGLSNEIQQKLTKQQPETVGQASRISGMTPAAISLLLVYLKRGSLRMEVAQIDPGLPPLTARGG